MRCLPHFDINVAYLDENDGILQAAVRKQNIDIVQYIVRRVSLQKINEVVEYNRITSSHLAPMMKNETITRILLEKQANVHAEDKKGRTLLLYAVKYEQLEQCRLLLQHGARIENRPKEATKLFNALFCHAKKLNINIFQFLIDHGLNPNTTDVYGKTILHRVAESTRIRNAVKCGELLLKYGANINAITRKGDSALHLAADNCSGLPFYELMFEKDADLNICNKKNKTFFDVVFERSEILLEGFIKYLVLAKARGKMDYNFGTVMLNPIESRSTFNAKKK
ncbi:putative ankyrin repeat protein RF_0381 [Harmonia axyridis]|uniref:putative ankyrin repeat protein RF_0381 n=1 Tax=Harmonia axyridis TaxID=115357 RepID=UPI001E274DE0|nr:putative ankyrin repeat protein RF_0381 [Harmonia axyridis]